MIFVIPVKSDAWRATGLIFSTMSRGAMHIEADGTTFTAEAGQLAITDCRRPHRYYTSGYTERIWIHIDGSNMDDFCQQILAFRGHRAFTPFPGSHTGVL